MGGEVTSAAALISPAAVVRSWLLLAWVSTVAGNLSLLGSAANLIVCEQARRATSIAHVVVVVVLSSVSSSITPAGRPPYRRRLSSLYLDLQLAGSHAMHAHACRHQRNAGSSCGVYLYYDRV